MELYPFIGIAALLLIIVAPRHLMISPPSRDHRLGTSPMFPSSFSSHRAGEGVL